MRVSVFGLGYVGAVSCACLSRDGFDVTGVDLSASKVRLINQRQTPIVEAEIGDLIAEAVGAGRLRATTDGASAVRDTDVSIVCVGTPSAHNGSLSLDAVRRVSEQIGAALREKPGNHQVVIRSTVLPGTVRTVLLPAIEQASGKTLGQGFGLSFNPEFLREGTSVYDYYNPPFTVIGSACDEDAGHVAALYAKVATDILRVSIETAEMVKYVCNAFHALKIAFANEIGSIAKPLAVDSHEVMRIACLDTKLNISPKYLRPGFAFGGSCLPKDVRALLYRARQEDLAMPLMAGVLDSNRVQIERGIQAVLGTKKRKVAMLGLSFKAGTDDLRESPLVTLAEALIGKGIDLRIFDDHVSMARLVGANKEYIEREIPHISSLLMPSLEETIRDADVIVIGNAGTGFEKLAGMARKGQVIIDLVRIDALMHIDGVEYVGINW